MHDLLAAAGPIADDYARVDWAASPLGPPEHWSPALVGALDLVLHSEFPAALLWGPDFCQVYNAAYVDLIGDKHPRALGRPTREGFPEVWPDLGPVMAGVLAGEGAVFVEGSLVPLNRRGFDEDCWFTFCYSPAHGPDGRPEGVVNIAMETTREVLAGRRIRLLAQLGDLVAEVDTAVELHGAATALLRAHPDLELVDIHPDTPVDQPGEPAVARGAADDRSVVRLPLRRAAPGVPDGSVVVGLNPRLAHDDAYRSFVQLVGGALSRAWERLDGLAVERQQALRLRSFATTLQESLLTVPPGPRDLDLAVRYRAAAVENQVGGDWYDSFVVGRDLFVSVGDVAGHDQEAAAQMAQVRGMLRGIAHADGSSPAAVLAALDDAMAGLALDGMASAVLAQVESRSVASGAHGVRQVRLSNAGHPPPVHLRRDGTAALVTREPELLLGVSADAARSDSLVELHPGESLLLYTDGLVERRDGPLDGGLDWLVTEVARHGDLSVDALCDHLLAEVGDVRDDVALLLVRVPPEPPLPARD